ncbi:hypothetical protein LJR153_001270 [Paenibacillus sp. LjRoot153]|uniref:hypothetical protein n=1 Tax=Paenibacillus sp. LjRoot153 TaxID=3342270 RepID=UPI003ECE2C56
MDIAALIIEYMLHDVILQVTIADTDIRMDSVIIEIEEEAPVNTAAKVAFFFLNEYGV